jgi:DNA invertase Pin-like site-specific DNA recombinase
MRRHFGWIDPIGTIHMPSYGYARVSTADQDLSSQIDRLTQAGCTVIRSETVGEFETAIRRERQSEGIARAKAKGIYRGRKPKIDRAEVIRLRGTGMGPAAIARTLSIGRASVYRVLEAQ